MEKGTLSGAMKYVAGTHWNCLTGAFPVSTVHITSALIENKKTILDLPYLELRCDLNPVLCMKNDMGQLSPSVGWENGLEQGLTIVLFNP